MVRAYPSGRGADVGSEHDLLRWTTHLSRKRVPRPFSHVIDLFSIALLEIRLLLSAIILKYEGWTGIPDSPEQWDKEMRPFETFVISPPKQKCVVKLKVRNRGE